MPYLLSLLGTESSIEGSEHLLCYYINDAANIQIIRLMNGAMCLSEHMTYSGEGILFTASPESYLEIYSPRINRTRVSIISCKRLRINEVSNLTKSDPKAQAEGKEKQAEAKVRHTVEEGKQEGIQSTRDRRDAERAVVHDIVDPDL